MSQKSFVYNIFRYSSNTNSNVNLGCIPLFMVKVSAGFPSPADDYIESKLDLNQYLIKHPAATFMMRITNQSLTNIGIHANDILIVDRSLKPTNGRYIIAIMDERLTLKVVKKSSEGKLHLVAPNSDLLVAEANEDTEISVWGVVTTIIHAV